MGTGKGQGVFKLLKKAKEREKIEKNVAEDFGEVRVDVLEGVEEKRVEEDLRFKERAPCVPRVQQPLAASTSPACHAV